MRKGKLTKHKIATVAEYLKNSLVINVLGSDYVEVSVDSFTNDDLLWFYEQIMQILTPRHAASASALVMKLEAAICVALKIDPQEKFYVPKTRVITHDLLVMHWVDNSKTETVKVLHPRLRDVGEFVIVGIINAYRNLML